MLISITGSNGFLGRYLSDYLVSNDYLVRRIQRSKSLNSFQVENIDAFTDWTDALRGVDVLIHCASRVHIMKSSKEDSINLYRSINVEGTKRLAEQAASLGVKRLIFISSSKANGESTKIDEFLTNQSPLRPIDPYGISKLEAENALQEVSLRTGLELVIIRPPLIYGPKVKANFLRLLKLVYYGVPLPFAKVDNLRSLLYIGNLADFIVKCINSPKAIGKTFLLSDLRPIATPELIRKLAKEFKKEVKLFSVSPKLILFASNLIGKGDQAKKLMGSFLIDPNYCMEELNWQHPFTTDQGLNQTCIWFLNHLNRKQ